MTLTRRERIMVVAGAVIVTLTAYIFYFLIPYINDTGDAARRYSEARSQLNLLKTKQAMSTQLQEEIDNLNGQLKGAGASVPDGIDHARILLYLKKITTGRAESLSVSMPNDPEIINRFLVQGVALDFNTTYPELLGIVADLKKNELYSRVSYLDVGYAQAEATAQPGVEASTEPAGPPDVNVLKVHLELSFFAMQPEGGKPATQPEAPSATQRSSSLMPEK